MKKIIKKRKRKGAKKNNGEIKKGKENESEKMNRKGKEKKERK